MNKREYSKCVQCEATIDITEQDIDLCVKCSEIAEERKAELAEDKAADKEADAD